VHIFLVRLAALSLLLGVVSCGKPFGAGDISAPELPISALEDKQLRQAGIAVAQSDQQILFGDLHVHSSFSPDAFATGMPIAGGFGLRPPAFACDYARYCSALDFWSINDHAEGITPRRWAETKESIRECNAVAGDPSNPDVVAFLGWEWSQVDTSPTAHFGHKNVIFLDTDDAKVPTRAIAAPREKFSKSPVGRANQFLMSLMDFENRAFYLGIESYYQEIADTPICKKGVNTRELPDDCLEIADNPGELFTKLDEWGFDSIVAPHGNSWGMNTPANTSFDKQLNLKYHDPRRQILFEIYSGHGNAEEYRDWRTNGVNEDGSMYCAVPGDDYLPCCWQAGNIIAERCDAAGEDAAICETRVAEARQNFVDAGVSGHLTVPGQQVEDWLNCGQCEDCFNEPLDHRPMTTGQYALAISNFDNPEKPLRFRFGIIGSSDNHGSSPGTGYKEVDRARLTDGLRLDSERLSYSMQRDNRDPTPYSIPLSEVEEVGLNKQRNMERQSSFWMTGGLVAVHSDGRDRQSIWDGLKSKNVYGTSGDRLLLWFDEVSVDAPRPMGSEISQRTNPKFRVSAIGAFEQLPGCPMHAISAMGEESLEYLCGGECYNPSDQRKLIDRIEIVRIRPQITAGEAVGSLIEDPWRVFDCDATGDGCSVEFEDPDFVEGQREVIYYARAVQVPSPMINGGGLRCEFDDAGQCIEVNPCHGDLRTGVNDDCTVPVGQRAWSSPIFVEYSPKTTSLSN
jgi:hypothetical protein